MWQKVHLVVKTRLYAEATHLYKYIYIYTYICHYISPYETQQRVTVSTREPIESSKVLSSVCALFSLRNFDYPPALRDPK